MKQWKAEQDAIRKRAAAASQQENRGNQYTAAKKVEVPPQVEATPAQHKTPTARDHATESQRKASTALAAQVGVNRAAVERADFIRKNSPTLAQKVIDGEVPASAAIREIRREPWFCLRSCEVVTASFIYRQHKRMHP